MSQSHTESRCISESKPAEVQTGPVDIDRRSGSEVTRIKDEAARNEGAFKPIYTGFDEEFEVELLNQVSADESPHENGHVVITRPDWDEPRIALPQNVRVGVEDDFQ